MRLRDDEIRIIREEVRRTFGSDATVRLFGSRVDDTRRGGDIDLYIESPGDERVFRTQERRLRHALLTRLGDQRIDLVTAPPGGKGRPIDDVARRDGVTLEGADA
ncbi:MAG: nucleotidyltransferase domain-containing protein [Halofilum sp. (in: g-proteobacteria)]